MGKIAFVFSGQGAQAPGMGMSLREACPAVRALYETAETMRPGITALSADAAPEELKQTVNAQPALYLCDLGAALALKEAGITPDACAGFSLGELPALAFSGVYSAADGFELVLKRARFMAEASDAMPGTPAMTAVMRLAPEEIEALCGQLENVWCANYNAPEQTVISGTAEGIAAFKTLCESREIKARMVDLPVSGAFHTPFMAAARDRFLPELKAVSMRRPAIPAYSNRTGGRYPDDPALYAELLASQINHPVRWVAEIQAMAEAGIDTFVECGIGKTLCGLIKKINKDAAVYSVENEETLKAAVEALSERI